MAPSNAPAVASWSVQVLSWVDQETAKEYHPSGAMVSGPWDDEDTMPNIAGPTGSQRSSEGRSIPMSSIEHARPMSAQEEAAYRRAQEVHETAQAALKQGGRKVRNASWSNDNSRMAWITDPDGAEWLRLQLIVSDEDRSGHAVFRQVQVLIPAKFTVIA
jgi:hypothetical protein